MCGRADAAGLGPGLSDLMDTVMLVERLKETRVLVGFSRFSSMPGRGLTELKAQLWKNQPNPHSSWLPAYETFGEGILIGIGEKKLREWEERAAVQEWVKLLVDRHGRAQDARGLDHIELPPRFVAHTHAGAFDNRPTHDPVRIQAPPLCESDSMSRTTRPHRWRRY